MEKHIRLIAKIYGALSIKRHYLIDTDSYHPVRLISKGKLYYYENGQAHIRMLQKGNDIALFGIGYESYISEGLNSETKAVNVGRKWERYKAKYPEYRFLMNCLEEHSDSEEQKRVCIFKYN